MDSYTIVINTSLEDIVSQVRAISSYPCVIKLYDRVFQLTTKDEMVCLVYGLEIGHYIAQDEQEKIK